MSIAMPSWAWIGPCTCVGRHHVFARLVLEDVDGVRGVVPQQVVRPASGFAQRIHVRAAEEVRLHVHLQDEQLAGEDPFVDPLVGRVEPAGVADHADESGLLLDAVDLFCVRPAVGQRDLHLHVLAGSHRRDRLSGVHLGGRAQDHRVDVVAREYLVEVGGGVCDAVPAGDVLRLLHAAGSRSP